MAEDEGINASGSQGVQVGSGNTQHNYYRPPDHSFLSTLSPHKAMARLRQMAHDDAVSALASVPPSDVIDVLKADEALTVALLADLNRRKAKELIGLLQADWPWLASLPEAAEAIARRASELKWDRGGNAGDFERVAATSDSSEGYVRKYASGLVYWNPPGAHELNGSFADAYLSSGGPSVLGLPRSSEAGLPTGGSAQIFEGGIIFGSAHGTYVVTDPVKGEYTSRQGTTGWLGFPVANCEDREEHRRQRFEGGVIFSSDAGTFAVRQAILDVFEDDEIPVSAEVEVTSPFATTGWTQESRYIDDVIDDPDVLVLTCSSEAYGTRYLTGGIRKRYRELGGPASWLGFPVSPSAGNSLRGRVQQFEGGAIYHSSTQVAAVTVPAETVALISGTHAGDLLGYGIPVSEEQSIGTDSSDRIQFFADAVVTLRDGKRELWPRAAEP